MDKDGKDDGRRDRSGNGLDRGGPEWSGAETEVRFQSKSYVEAKVEFAGQVSFTSSFESVVMRQFALPSSVDDGFHRPFEAFLWRRRLLRLRCRRRIKSVHLFLTMC